MAGRAAKESDMKIVLITEKEANERQARYDDLTSLSSSIGFSISNARREAKGVDTDTVKALIAQYTEVRKQIGQLLIEGTGRVFIDRSRQKDGFVKIMPFGKITGGSVDCKLAKKDFEGEMRAGEVNWCAIGAQDPDTAEAFAYALRKAATIVRAADKKAGL